MNYHISKLASVMPWMPLMREVPSAKLKALISCADRCVIREAIHRYRQELVSSMSRKEKDSPEYFRILGKVASCDNVMSIASAPDWGPLF